MIKKEILSPYLKLVLQLTNLYLNGIDAEDESESSLLIQKIKVAQVILCMIISLQFTVYSLQFTVDS